MKFAVRNIKETPHTICRFTGHKVKIQPKDFVIIDTDNYDEYQYWKSLDKKRLFSYGIDVLFDEAKIAQISNNNYTDTSIIDGFVSPIAKEIASTSNNVEDEDNKDSQYTEENLLKLAKEDLFNICDNFNIKYKRNR